MALRKTLEIDALGMPRDAYWPDAASPYRAQLEQLIQDAGEAGWKEVCAQDDGISPYHSRQGEMNHYHSVLISLRRKMRWNRWMRKYPRLERVFGQYAIDEACSQALIDLAAARLADLNQTEREINARIAAAR